MRFKTLLIILFLHSALAGCSWLATNTGYQNDPLTGGINTQTSNLLNVSIPAGMQLYPSHGYTSQTEAGVEGLETWRGNVDAHSVAISMFNTLKNAGWQLRMSGRRGQRALYLYQKNKEFAILAFHPQGMLTIMEILAGPNMPDGATLSLPKQAPDEDLPSLPAEEFGPIDEYDAKQDKGQKGQVETWGDTSGIQEKEL